MRRIAVIITLMALLFQGMPSAGALGLGPMTAVPKPGPGGPNAVPCDNQNPASSLCEPFKWVDAFIVGDVWPQIVYRAWVAHTAESREIPMGFISTPFMPVATSTAPRTYWFRTITNLTSTRHKLVMCTSGFTAPECNTTAYRFDYDLAPGESRSMPDPANQTPRAIDSFPPNGVQSNQDIYLTSLSGQNPRSLRAMVTMVYYDPK